MADVIGSLHNGRYASYSGMFHKRFQWSLNQQRSSFVCQITKIVLNGI